MISTQAFEPILDEHILDSKGDFRQYIDLYAKNFPDWEQADIVLIGLKSKDELIPGYEAANRIRGELYKLSCHRDNIAIADLGNYNSTQYENGEVEALSSILETLRKLGKLVLLFGGSQDVCYSQYLACKSELPAINYVQLDGQFDFGEIDGPLNRKNYNSYILEEAESHIFQFANLGYQKYLVSSSELKLLKELGFQGVRYGLLHEDFQEVEPHLRTADMISVDISAVRTADAPATYSPSPGGLDVLEAAQFARYAGLGLQLHNLSITEYVPVNDINNQTARLIALMIWYLVEGRYSRQSDDPRIFSTHLQKYQVQIDTSISQIVFYRHRINNRWWMEVPYPDSLGNKKLNDAMLIACSQKDYQAALKKEIPERWWNIFNKL